jgi:hypothetical protein
MVEASVAYANKRLSEASISQNRPAKQFGQFQVPPTNNTSLVERLQMPSA